MERAFEEKRSGDSGAWSVCGRQPERIQRVNAETTKRVDVPRTRRVHTCLSLSVYNKLPESSRANPVRFLPSYELCYTGAETREGSRNAAAIMSSPTGSPFAHVIQLLAGLHQEHHQALLDMREDQERRFCALVQNQQEDRELFRSWMDREVRAGGIPTALTPPTHMPVQKMGPQDDPEAFLDLFEKTAEACGWAQTDWPVRLIPLLTGEAQLAAQQLPVQNLLVYDDLKRAILQRVGRSTEQHRQRFRSLELGENGRPFAMAHQLRDTCRRWLLAGEGGVEQIIDRVVLEQFIARLPKKTAQWVQCHRPASLDLAIQLAEDQMVACHGVGELLDRLGTARFYSTLDLTKGYWQIPLSKEKSAFTTPFGLHQFVTLPFGLFGAPATFQRLMDKILRPHTAYAAAYLDGIIIYSQDWQQHMVHLREVLRAPRGAGLTANPKKCAIGRVEVRYLGFHLGHRQVRPQIDKTAAIAACPRPKTKKDRRQFLGLAGYYRRFIPDYSELTSPLTDLTKKEVPDTVPWTERCQQVFTQVKAALCGGPLLHSPDFSLPFLLQTDASDRGLGAVLTQEIGGEERPVLYISRKLSKRETMYSTIEKEATRGSPVGIWHYSPSNSR